MSVSVIDLVNKIILEAATLRASDIHIDPHELDTVVRFRIDGQLQQACVIARAQHEECVARIKVMAGLRTDERIMPQDGRYTFNMDLDIRVTTAASYYGECLVLRLLDRKNKTHSLSALGFSLEQQKTLSGVLNYTHGLVLVTGPTGSGKTTTLYTLLQLLNRTTDAVVTLEDPIEYAMPGIRQLQVQARRGLHFANGLRSVLRQDPDIIMVGEIRDLETARLAIQAALTGHLVISTLHTNSAVTTIDRLRDMGIESYLIAATLRLVVNQRLARMICTECITKRPSTEPERVFIAQYDQSKESFELASGIGCSVCHQTGYKGRSVVAEILSVTPKIADSISTNVNSVGIQLIALDEGLQTMTKVGITKCLDHSTTIDEIMTMSYE
jgi:type II secretory ATPase GspE/PulE/Tfp pilus assembly ATPase PilB-like protein